MRIAEVITWLVDNEYLLFADNKPVLTNKFTRDAGSEGHITTTPTVQFPTDQKQLWNKFIEDAEVPWRVKATDGGTYTVRQFNKPAAAKLAEIIHNPITDYQVLVESTKNYYRTVSYKLLLSKYLLNDVWADEYKQWTKGVRTVAPGLNRFES